MENKTAEEYLKKIGIEDRVLNREDLPEYWKSISQILYEYTSQQLAEKDKVIDIFAIGFAKWIRENGYGYSKKFNLYQKSLINETIFFYEKELIELYKQSLNK